MLHPAGERSGQSPLPAPFPTGGRAPARPSPVPTLQAHGPRRRRERSGVGPSSLAGAHSPRRLPGGGLEPRTPLRPPPRLRASGRLGPSGRGVEAAAARPPGPLRAHSLAARGAALPPAPGPSRSGRRGPFCLQNRSEPVTWVPAPSPPPTPPGKDLPRPLPLKPAPPPDPDVPASAPAPRPRRFCPGFPPRVPAPPVRPARAVRARTTGSAGPPSSESGVCRPQASLLPWLPRPLPQPQLSAAASAPTAGPFSFHAGCPPSFPGREDWEDGDWEGARSPRGVTDPGARRGARVPACVRLRPPMTV